ncbi:DUF6527 family protein [Bradyrhizobium lablabi]|uniref:DUF6527 family protein n=1 Tax=Bradyrhizobium lablabi TaxID=722472 RepID=UPI001BA61C10|nr:DUF6527 family protein [Bradyrhizobium lablabi]MBR0695339.1 hypothetical protein [Bradyrhizobium lablabi]
MIRTKQLRHRFVETMPDNIETGVLYVSMEYATAAHRCCCGCGEEVITPFNPAQWQMSFNGDAVSLHPSVGNWNLRCRSHYFVREGRVIEAPSWTKKQIEAGQKRDKDARTQYLADKSAVVAAPQLHSRPVEHDRSSRLIGWFKSMFV